MERREASGKNRALWYCPRCRVACVRERAPRQHGPLPADRPHCVRCRRQMIRCSKGRLACPACRVYVTPRPKTARRFDVDRPECPACGRSMALASRGRFTCGRCRTVRRRLRRRPEEARELLARVTRALPSYLAPDERDDAAQSVMLDILAGRLAPYVPAPAALKGYASRARGMMRDGYRFKSLSAPTRGGREFGDTLAA